MARPRASDYDDKRSAILSRSAELFALHGFDRASMSSIAAACGVSKALVYHYYPNKESLLFDVIRSHLEELLETVQSAHRAELSPIDQLRGLIRSLLRAYQGADAQHSLQINNIRLLPRPRQDELRAMERELVHIFGNAIGRVRPELADSALLAPVTMSLFGMLNWAYLWLKPGGAMSREQYADLVTKIVVDGSRDIQEELGQKTKAGKRPPRETSKRKTTKLS